MFCIDSYGVLKPCYLGLIYYFSHWLSSLQFLLVSVSADVPICFELVFSLCFFCVPVSSAFDLRLSVKLTIVSHSDVFSCFILVTVLLFVWRCVYFPHLIIRIASSCASYLLCICLLSCVCIYCLYLTSLPPSHPYECVNARPMFYRESFITEWFSSCLCHSFMRERFFLWIIQALKGHLSQDVNKGCF